MRTYASEIMSHVMGNPDLQIMAGHYETDSVVATFWNHTDNRFYEVTVKPLNSIKESSCSK